MQKSSNAYRYKNHEKGAVIMVAVMIFLVLSVTVVLGIALPISAQIRNSALVLQTKKSVFAADVLADDALYRLNLGRTLPSTMVLSMNGASSSAIISDVTGGKQIIALGESGAIDRYSKTKFIQGAGIAIAYGLQVGTGGFEMSGGPTIYGNVYSNGNVVASGGSTVTGSLIAASVSEFDTDLEVFDATTTPWGSQTLGTVNGIRTIAQKFRVSTTTPVTAIELYVKKTGTPANATIKIMNDSAGSVGTTQIGGNGSMSAAYVTTGYGWVKTFPYTPATLVPGTDYWVTINYSGTNANYYTLAMNNGLYDVGSVKIKTQSGAYYNATSSSQDLYFKIYTGSLSTISGINVGGTASAGIVNSSNVSGSLYCQGGTSNNKTCDISQPLPAPTSFPITDTYISAWKAEATAGTVRNSSWTIGGSTATSTNGPMKIVGNLTVQGGGSLTLNGPLYVTGLITVEGGGRISLASSYGAADEKIVANRVVLGGGGQITGNGTAGSYVLVIADGTDCVSSCPSDMTGRTVLSTGGAGSVVLVAPYGTIEFAGGAAAKSAIAKKMILSGGATLSYEAGLSDISFITAGSEGWGIESWKEVEQ